MSVPLDRLYNFLSNICNRNDLLIYRFFPHGSKKLEHLVTLTLNTHSWFHNITSHNMIFHDQEPLQYDFYNNEDFLTNLQKRKRLWRAESESALRCHADVFYKMLTPTHIRSKIHFPINANDQVLLCHSEKNSSELERYEQNNFIGVYYWSHALIARDWFRHARLDPVLVVNFEQITKDFLIYNRAWASTREYRLTFIEILLNQNLHTVCKVTFNDTDSGNHYADHKFTNVKLAIARKDIENYIGPTDASASASADYNNTDYATTAIEVVLETLFDDSRNHLTEKSLRPIACGRPFILAATPNSLQYLRDYGFETFHGLIDESYDTISDPRERLCAIANEMQRINLLSPDSKQKLWQQLYTISTRNKQLFFSDQWHNDVVSEFKKNFDSSIQRVTATNKYWNKIKRLVPDYHDDLICDADELEQFNDWLSSRQS